MIAAITAIFLSSATPYPAKFVKCQDGDTCTFDLQLGFGVQVTRDVRFCGIDAPELNKGSVTEKDYARGVKRWMENRLRRADRILVWIELKPRCLANNCEKYSFHRVVGRPTVDGREVLADAIQWGIVESTGDCSFPVLPSK